MGFFQGILSRWFRDRELAIVLGLLLCVARLTKWAAKMVCYPVVNATGSHSWPIHIATFFCAAGVLMNGVYWIVMCYNGWATATGKEIAQPKHKYRNHFGHHHHHQNSASDNRRSLFSTASGARPSKFKFSFRLFLYVPGTFWMVPWIQLIMSSVLSSFEDIAT